MPRFFENLSFIFIIYYIRAITILSQQESERVLNIFLFCKIFTNDGFFLIVVSDLENAILYKRRRRITVTLQEAPHPKG